jgi:hypothetical protein
VIAQREQHVARLRRLGRSRPAQQVTAIIANPVMEILFTQAS